MAYNEEDNPMEKTKTRSGYEVGEAVRAFQTTLHEAGATAAGKCLHYSADIISSGALQVWERYCMEYAIDHIGSTSPRIFLYLQNRFNEINTIANTIDISATLNSVDNLYKNFEFQIKIGEIVLILRDCPKRSKVALPKINQFCFEDNWLSEARSTSTNFKSVQKIGKPSADAQCMNIVGNEIMKSIEEGATEKALFWMRWLLDMDTIQKKKTNGVGLSTLDRGPPGWPDKQRTSVGFFLVNLASEAYKDLASSGKMKMDEEFNTIVGLYKHSYKLILTSRRRLDLLCLLFQLLCEVPRWKTPSAPQLVKDPIILRKGLTHVEHFFREVLAFPSVKNDILKEAKKAKANATIKKKDIEKRSDLENRLRLYDEISNEMNR